MRGLRSQEHAVGVMTGPYLLECPVWIGADSTNQVAGPAALRPDLKPVRSSSALAVFAQRNEGPTGRCAVHLQTLLAAEARRLELSYAPLGLRAARPIDLDLPAAGIAAVRA